MNTSCHEYVTHVAQPIFLPCISPQQMPYYVHIARFMPHVEIVQNHSSTVRRLFIRGDNGKVVCYPVFSETKVVDNTYIGIPIPCGQ